jgi:hypothetical protein
MMGVPMADQSDLAGDLLRGGKQIARVLYNDDSPEAVRRLYHEQRLWPVFQLDENGVLYASRSRLLAYIAGKSAEAEAKAEAHRLAGTKPTPISKPPKPRRRRRAA